MFGEITDLIFTVLGKLGRWLNVKGKRFCFVLWAVCLVYWMARNWGMDLWVQTGGCVVSLCLHVYGYWNWGKNGIGKKETAAASAAKDSQRSDFEGRGVVRWHSTDGESYKRDAEKNKQLAHVEQFGVRFWSDTYNCWIYGRNLNS